MKLMKHVPWLVPLALIGLVGTAAILRPTTGEMPSHSVRCGEGEKPSAEQGTPSKATVPPIANQDRAHTSDQQDECKTCSEHEKADLYEQRRMAKAAEQQALFTVIGSGLVVLSLIFTGWAAFEASRAARAAQDAIMTERAWMSQSGFETARLPNLFIDDQPAGEGFGIVLRWKNTGRSPAVHTQAVSWHRLVEPHSHIPVFPTVMGTGIGSNVGPGEPVTGVLRTISEADYKSLLKGSLDMYIYGRIDYEDIFTPGHKRHSEVCAKVEFNGEHVDEMGRRIPRVVLIPQGPQNTVS